VVARGEVPHAKTDLDLARVERSAVERSKSAATNAAVREKEAAQRESEDLVAERDALKAKLREQEAAQRGVQFKIAELQAEVQTQMHMRWVGGIWDQEPREGSARV